ncbi:MAG TPA: tRNA (adenosine(37)-N6)-threonylcarbamoyltransferase complex ATPase subunit type 1 TsaE [bacterium]|jgi:tRNA threonylcarbamoyladenosine biosynthesis protein TsaE
MSDIITTHSPAETEHWAEAFAASLTPGTVIALFGDLGAGKTVIAKGIGKGLGVSDAVISPSFNYVLEYKGKLPFFHADLYRIEGAATFEAMGFDEYFDRNGVFVIEWAERVRDLLPPDALWIEIETIANSSERRIAVKRGAP